MKFRVCKDKDSKHKRCAPKVQNVSPARLQMNWKKEVLPTTYKGYTISKLKRGKKVMYMAEHPANRDYPTKVNTFYNRTIPGLKRDIDETDCYVKTVVTPSMSDEYAKKHLDRRNDYAKHVLFNMKPRKKFVCTTAKN